MQVRCRFGRTFLCRLPIARLVKMHHVAQHHIQRGNAELPRLGEKIHGFAVVAPRLSTGALARASTGHGLISFEKASDN
jgi:hypothetical protein